MRFSPEFLDQLRERLSLAEIIGSKVRLQRRGREYVGLCPFHNEKTPSFTVVEDKGFYHCFGCSAHGDVISFLTETEGVSFPEAVENLAARAGLPVPVENETERADREQRKTLYDVMATAASWFESQLQTGPGSTALAYLEKRGIGATTIKAFGLGFAPAGRSALKEAMLARKISEQQLIDTGLLIKPDDVKASYDRFRDRIIFPISDARDRIIAFGGRAMDKNAKAKYLNSPETILFHKGRILYNLSRARKAAYDAGSLLVAEGYMDVIALSQAGFPYAVAPLGTALTEDQIALAWRMASEPVLCFDGDKAGKSAAGRALERALPLLKPGYSLKFALMPEGEDPDSVLRSEGKEAVRKIISSSRSASEMLWQLLTLGADTSTPERRAGLEKKVYDSLGNIKDDTVRRFYRNDFKNRLFKHFRFQPAKGGARASLKKRLAQPATGDLKKTRLGKSSGEKAVKNHNEELVTLVILNPPQILLGRHEEFVGMDFQSEELSRLRDSIVEWASNAETLDREGLNHHLVEKDFEKLYTRLTQGDSLKSDWFAWPDADLADAEKGWLHVLSRHHELESLFRDIRSTEEELNNNWSDEGYRRLTALQEEIHNAAGDEFEIEGLGLASGRHPAV